MGLRQSTPLRLDCDMDPRENNAHVDAHSFAERRFHSQYDTDAQYAVRELAFEYPTPPAPPHDQRVWSTAPPAPAPPHDQRVWSTPAPAPDAPPRDQRVWSMPAPAPDAPRLYPDPRAGALWDPEPAELPQYSRRLLPAAPARTPVPADGWQGVHRALPRRVPAARPRGECDQRRTEAAPRARLGPMHSPPPPAGRNAGQRGAAGAPQGWEHAPAPPDDSYPRTVTVMRFKKDGAGAPQRPDGAVCGRCQEEHRVIREQVAQGLQQLYVNELETRGRLRDACGDVRANTACMVELCSICNMRTAPPHAHSSPPAPVAPPQADHLRPYFLDRPDAAKPQHYPQAAIGTNYSAAPQYGPPRAQEPEKPQYIPQAVFPPHSRAGEADKPQHTPQPHYAPAQREGEPDELQYIPLAVLHPHHATLQREGEGGGLQCIPEAMRCEAWCADEGELPANTAEISYSWTQP